MMMKPLLRHSAQFVSDPATLPWDRGLDASPTPSSSLDDSVIPCLEWPRICHHLPDLRRIRIDINGCLAGSPSCITEAIVEFAVGWAFFNRFFSAPCELGKITSSSQRVSIMVDSGVDLDRRRYEAIGWIDEADQTFLLPVTREHQSSRAPKAVPVVDDLDVLSICERVFRRFDADDANIGYVHAALATRDDVLCIARDVTTDVAAMKILGWMLEDGDGPDSSMLIVRGVVDAPLIGAAARAGVAIIVTDTVPTRAAVELASEVCLTVVGLALSHRRGLFADGGHIAISR